MFHFHPSFPTSQPWLLYTGVLVFNWQILIVCCFTLVSEMLWPQGKKEDNSFQKLMAAREWKYNFPAYPQAVCVWLQWLLDESFIWMCLCWGLYINHTLRWVLLCKNNITRCIFYLLIASCKWLCSELNIHLKVLALWVACQKMFMIGLSTIHCSLKNYY